MQMFFHVSTNAYLRTYFFFGMIFVVKWHYINKCSIFYGYFPLIISCFSILIVECLIFYSISVECLIRILPRSLFDQIKGYSV